MKSFTALGTYVLNKCWTAAALLLVAVAVLISLLRYSLPYMDGQKHHLETWLAEKYGAQLSIGLISATWKGVGPAIVLRDLTLKNGDESALGLHIDETQIEIDFWSSIASRQLISKQFNLIGMDVRVNLNAIEAGEGDTPVVDAIETLFLEHLQRFSVMQSRLHLVNGAEQQVIDLQQLEWNNEGDIHLGKGKLRVEELAQNSATFALDLRGDDDNLTGTFYANAEDLDFSPWLQEVLHPSQHLVASRVSMELWASVDRRELTALQFEVNPSEIVWQDDKDRRHQALLEGGNFQAVPSLDGWQFDLTDMRVRIDDQPSHLSHWRGKKDYLGHYQLSLVDEVNLRPLVPLLSMTTDAKGFDLIEQMSPSARVKRLTAFTSSEGPKLAVDFDALSVRETGQVPGVEQLMGTVSWLGSQGRVTLSANSGELLSNALLGHTLAYDRLNISAFVNLDDGGVSVFADDVSLEGEALTMRHQFRYVSDGNRLSWAGSIDALDMARVRSLLPVTLMGKGTKAWLDRGLVSGKLASANVIWHGALDQYPFANDQGIFQASVGLRDTELRFAKQWPTITELDLDLLFENEALVMRSSKAKLLKTELNSLYAIFPELSGTTTLSIDAQVSAQGDDIAEVMQQSALSNSVGAALAQAQIRGKVEGKLHLDIPMRGQQVVASGQVNLDQVPLYIAPLDLTLDKATGVIAFENSRIDIQGLDTELFGQPTQIRAKGWQGEDAYLTEISLDGGWQMASLLTEHHQSLTPYMQGDAQWQGKVDLAFPRGGFSFDARVKSDLMGLQSSLPSPYAKSADKPMSLTIDAEGNRDTTAIRILLGDDVRFNGVLQHQQRRITRAHLSMGDDDFVGMGQGFTITANLDELAIEPWYQAVKAVLDKPSSAGILPSPKRIIVNADKTRIAGQIVKDVSFNVRQTDLSWQVDVSGEQVRGDLDFFKDWSNEGVAINVDFLSLDELGDVESGDGIDPASLPPIKLRCGSCRVKGIDLGKLQATLVPGNQGMQVETFLLDMPHGRIDATGFWTASHGQQQTNLKGRFQSDDLGVYLKTLDVDSGLRDSDATLNFDLSWQQAPYGFEVASLNGGVDWRLGDGYLAEVSDKGARLFSVLSLKSLIRKLRLDFRDVFAKGFFYDSMSGSFAVQNGIVTTDDTRIDGAAADIRLAGQTNLNNRQLAYDIDIAPKVTSSIPVIVAWMVNPATALAALALDEVITSAKVISDIEYKLTGTLEAPVLSEVGRRSKNVALPVQNRPNDAANDPLAEPVGINKGY